MIASDAPPGTFVPADDNIFGPTDFGATWLVLGIVAVVLGLTVVVLCLHRLPVERHARRRPTDVPALKAKYLSTIDDLGRAAPAHFREEFRTRGPSNYPQHGRQPERSDV